MNLIQKWLYGNVIKEVKRASFQMNTRFQLINGRLVTPADNKKNYIDEGYNKNAIVYSVINKILNKAILPEWGLYKVVDESKYKKAERMLLRKDLTFKEVKKALQLKAESVEPLTEFDTQATKLKGLLKYANSQDTFSDHQRSLFLYKLLVGDYYEWGEVLTGGANAGVPNALWSLPAHLVNIKVTKDFPAKPTAYELYTFNREFTTNQVLHERYTNPNWNINGGQLYGFSPLKPYLRNLNRNNSAIDSATAKFQNGGAEFMMWADDERLDPAEGVEQAKLVKTKWNEEYSGPDNAGKVVISGIKMGGMPIGKSPVELGIIDTEQWDSLMLCNIYDVPAELLGLTQKTYNNVIEAQKALILGAVMPLLISRRNALNWKLQTDWGFKDKNIYCDFETDCFHELMPNSKDIIEASNGIMMITPNEQREMINMEARPEPEADEPWIKQDRVPLSDYEASIVDNALNANNGTGNGAANGQTNLNGNGVSQNGKYRVPLS